MGPLTTINKPCINETDASQVQSAFEVIISNIPSTPISNDVLDDYKLNMIDQDNNRCFNEIPKAQTFLKRIIDGDLEELMQTIYTHKLDDTYSSKEKQVVNLLKYIMSDYHANCEKPAYYTDTIERTPYCECIIRIFKYFSAVYKNISFMW